MKTTRHLSPAAGRKVARIISVTALAAVMASCSTTQYLQVYDIMPCEGVELRDGYPVYDDGTMAVAYDFWGNGGQAGCLITNNGEENIYVDLAETFFVKNGLSDPCYKERTYTVTSASTVEANAVALSSASATVSAPFYNYIYDFAGTVGVGLSDTRGVMRGVSSSASNSVSVAEQQIVVIPPGTAAFVGGHSILSGNYYTNRGSEQDPGSKKKDETEFSTDNSPLKFGNVIAYRIGRDGEWQDLRSEFYLQRLTDYPLSKFYKTYSRQIKSDDVYIWRDYDGTYDYSPLREPTRFYFTYEYKRGAYRMKPKTLLEYDESAKGSSWAVRDDDWVW